MQLLDGTPAVLSPGKLCGDHGYSYVWVSGQKPRLTNDGKTIICKTDNFVPLVVPRISTHPESSSSSTSPSQDWSRREVERATREVVPPASSSSSSSVSERSDEPASRRLVPFSKIQKKKNKIKRGVTRRIRKIRWQIFLTGCRISKKERNRVACIRTQFSRIRSWISYASGNEIKETQYFTHFPKDQDCDVCLRTKITRAPCRGRTGEALPRAEKFGDLITADHKVLNEGCESRGSHRYAVVVQDIATQWIQSYPCENKIFTWDREKFIKIIGAVAQTESCFHRQHSGDGKEFKKNSRTAGKTESHLHWQLVGIWQILWRSITESSNLNTSSIRDKMELLKEQYAE